MAKVESDEVNLLDLMASFTATLKKNILLTILVPLAGVVIALSVAYSSRDLFESSLLVETSLLSENECRFLFNQLDKVGIIPGLTQEEDNQVAGFQFEVIKNEVTDNGPAAALNERSIYVQVTARVYNEKVFPALEKAVVKFFNESPSVVRHRSEREKFYGEMIARLEKEISAMDDIKRKVDGNAQATFLNPADLFSNSVELHMQKIQFEIKRDEIRLVHQIKGFDSLTVDAKTNKVIIGALGFVIGLGVLFVLLFLKFFIRYFTIYEKTH